ncbi:MAG: hypothetical protein EOO63_06020 [Hymenobacter sp.]|nr:MAG: hypothetical protein EOO63_06020 [Hymenobacter sp.]
MANHWFYLPLLSALAACSSYDDSRAPATDSPTPLITATPSHIPVSEPVLIDSSDYVMYPLSLGEIETEDESLFGSRIRYSSNGREATYWNILFYNPNRDQYHLLSSRKLLIRSFTGQESGNLSSHLHNRNVRGYAADNLLYYSIIITDFNHDGQLTQADPTYLFTSDKAGQNFRQISPDSLQVVGWDIQKNTGNILINTVQDSNHNRKFDDDDESIPYIYNLTKQQPARRAFSSDFMKQLSTQFKQQWPKKP